MKTGDFARLDEYLGHKGGLTWIDMLDTENGAAESSRLELAHILSDHFGFHALAVEDVMTESNTPKVDDWGTYIYVVLHAVKWDTGLKDVDTAELDLFVGKNFIITYRTESIPSLERLLASCMRDERHTRRGSDYLLYEIADGLASDYMPCIDAMEAEIDGIEDQIFRDTNPIMLARIFKLRSAVLALRRVLGPQREVMNRLARDSYQMIDVRDRVYFRDVYDHFVRLAELNESLRDLITGALDTYLSVTANRTNDVMKVLTIFTILMAPLTVITGYFGMNFFADAIVITPPIGAWPLFAIAMALMIFVPLLLLLYIRRRGWW